MRVKKLRGKQFLRERVKMLTKKISHLNFTYSCEIDDLNDKISTLEDDSHEAEDEAEEERDALIKAVDQLKEAGIISDYMKDSKTFIIIKTDGDILNIL